MSIQYSRSFCLAQKSPLRRDFVATHSSPWNRRTFLQTSAAGLADLAFASAAHAGARDKQVVWTPLKQMAANKGIRFGFALNYHLLSSNPAYDALVARECSIVTPENAMKWEGLHPAPDEYTFTQADAIVAFARKHSMTVRGHCFCWHRALPAWVTQNTTKENAQAILEQHISTVAGHYKGKLYSWDVVNEAIQFKDNQPNAWRNSFWYQMLGPRYVDIAFHAAQQADPKAVLTYNDYGLEYENNSDTPKRATCSATSNNAAFLWAL
jgi:endo-1,4-beta-xylanase